MAKVAVDNYLYMHLFSDNSIHTYYIKETIMKKKYFNPCKKCLVSPCCSKECNDKKLYRNTRPDIGDILTSIIIAVWTVICFIPAGVTWFVYTYN